MSQVIPLSFGAADLAASAGGASVPLLGIPDVADILNRAFPWPTEIVGIELYGKPAAGDTFSVQPYIGGAIVSGSPVVVTATNAAPVASWFAGPGDGITLAPGVTIGAWYLTTTGGTYAAVDVMAVIWLAVPDRAVAAGRL